MNKILKIQELKSILDDDAITKDEYQLLLKEILADEDSSKTFSDTSMRLKDYSTTMDLKFEDFEEGPYRITIWLKTIGAKIEIGEAYLEIESDKAIIEVPANVSGVLIEQLFPVGYSVTPNDIIGRVETDESKALKIIENNIINFESTKIGNQEWMTQNLNVRYFRNGDYIPEAKTDKDWLKANEKKQPAWCYYNNIGLNGAKYGKLYNWYAVNDPRGIAPAGWHVPSEKEWDDLVGYVGGRHEGGTILKASSGWNDSDNGTDEVGFRGLPGGYRFNGTFYSVGGNGFWWSSTEDDTNDAWFRNLNFHDGDVFRGNYDKGEGMSVRYLRD